MNKKIMVIELLEMFFKKEKMPKRIKVGAFEFEYREELNAYFNINEKSSCEDLLENWFEDARQLNQEVEILEDNTEEIEEIELIGTNFMDMDKNQLKDEINKNRIFINKLRQEIFELRKDKNND